MAVMALLASVHIWDLDFAVVRYFPMAFEKFNDGTGAMVSYEAQDRMAIPTEGEKAAIAGELDRLVAMMPQVGPHQQRVANLRANPITIGRILPSHCRALGLDPAKARIVFNSPGSIDEGLKHWLKHHADTLNGKAAVELMEKTIWNPAAKPRSERRNRKTRLIYEWRDDDGTWNVIDAWSPPDQYFDNRANKIPKKATPDGAATN